MSILSERIKRMKEKGIPMPITQMNINEGSIASVPITPSNQDKHAKLAALKSGANRQQIQSLVKAKGSKGEGGFEALPEPRMRKNPNQPANKVSDPSLVVKPQENFGSVAPVSNEFSAIEAMYGGGSDVNSYSNTQPIFSDQPQEELQVQKDGYGPTFDPVAMLQKKRALQTNESEQGYNYMKHVVNPNIQKESEDAPQQFNFKYMQQMMQEIARKTISEVLSEYTEKNKKNLTYENVKTKGDIKVIKTQDGKYYKLTPVTLTKG